MKLTESELNSPLWLKLKEHWEKRLQTLRAENDKSLNESDTTKLRGRIAEIKANIEIGNPKPIIEME